MHQNFHFFKFLILGMTMAQASAGPGESLDIGNQRQLMLDPHLAAEFSGAARLQMHHPIRREIALEHDEPWEGNGSGYHTVFFDPYLEKYRMYYKSWQIPSEDFPSHPVFIAYAESDDGIHWEKPSLGLHEFQGSRDNNILLKTIQGEEAHDFSVFIDRRPGVHPDERYKAVGFHRNPWGLYGFVSPDGYDWKPIQEEPILTGYAFDTQNIAFWDPNIGKYRLYIRHLYENPRRRGIMTATSEDFLHWSTPEWLDYPGAEAVELYVNQIKPYYRAPHLYIGFPVQYIDRGWTRSTEALPEPGRRKHRAGYKVNREGETRRYGTAVTESLLMASRDGTTFHRWNEAFLRPGLRTRHNWSYGDNYLAWHAVETESSFDDMPRELSLFATESYFTGLDSRLRRYALRIDGFVSATASKEGGSLRTRLLRFGGDKLLLNFSTAASGHIKCEIQDSAGNPIEGFTASDCDLIFGDDLERAVAWNGESDLSHLTGRPIRIKIFLKDADLYSFIFSR